MKMKCESEVVQSCPTLSDPMDCSLPGSFVHGIFQARGPREGQAEKKKGKGLNIFKSSKFKIIKDQNYKSLESQSRCLDIKVILKSQLHFYVLTANN